MPHPNLLNSSKTALVIVDIQEAFRSAIPDFALIASRASTAVRGFQILGVPVFVTKLEELGIKQIVLCGLETHVCVNQTAHDLLDRGYQVHILTDCVCSRFEHDKLAGLTKMRESGV